DSVFYLGENLQLQSISESVNELLFRAPGGLADPEDPDNNDHLGILNTRYKIAHLTEASGIVIGCGYNEDSYDEFWAFNLDTKAWTRFMYACSYFNVFTIGSRLILNDYPDGQIFGVEPPGRNDTWDGTELWESPPIPTLVPVQKW
ncbi:unnamed protein product, partial [marine sediment metagenome]